MCVLDKRDPKKECDCIVTEEDPDKRNKMDWDGDFVHNKCDNCKFTQNANQRDNNTDGVGDLCEKCGGEEPCPNLPQYDEVQEQEETNYDKKSMVAALMEKLLEIYYSE